MSPYILLGVALTMTMLLIAVALFLVLLSVREHWVKTNVQHIILEQPSIYNKLPCHGYMVMTFWIWDIRKYIKEG